MKSISNIAKNTYNNLPEAKRSRILAESVREFAVQGFRKASVNAIVSRVGIAKGSLYQYFVNKEALFLFVFEQFTERVKESVRDFENDGLEMELFSRIKMVLLAGIAFIDKHPEYYQIYLKVLSEQDIPGREVLLSKVRLFSADYFGPYCEEARLHGHIRTDVPDRVVIFMIDAVLDRFLQGYAALPSLEKGLILSGRTRPELEEEVSMIISILRDGLSC